VFPVKYELNFVMLGLSERNLAFKEMKTLSEIRSIISTSHEEKYKPMKLVMSSALKVYLIFKDF
jgi:hypothetical protein